MIKSKYKNLKATPQTEDFEGKYENKGKIANFLVNNYFASVEKLLNKIEQKNIKKALEIGCGAGYSTEKIFKLLSTDTKLFASEYVKKLVPIARIRNPKVNIVQENIYELKRKPNSIDLVFLLEVLEHLDYPEDALAQIKKVSSKYLILGVPREPIWRILNMARLRYLKNLGNTPGHLNHWSRSGIIKFVEANFGKVIAIESPLPWTIVLAEKE